MKSSLRESFEARPAPPRKRERPTKAKASAAPRKRAKHVEGARQNKNGKWTDTVKFPGREFDDLDAYRAAKKQRKEQRAAYSDQTSTKYKLLRHIRRMGYVTVARNSIIQVPLVTLSRLDHASRAANTSW